MSSASSSRPSDSMETAFAPGGLVSVTLSPGGYRIVAGSDDLLRLSWSVERPADLKKVAASADVDGSQAEVRLDGPRRGFQGRIEVPARSDLDVHLAAGELEVDGVVGDKDLRLDAGELRVVVGSGEDYRLIDASAWAGEVSAAPFQSESGGLFPSLRWQGQGEHELKARVRAGEIELL